MMIQCVILIVFSIDILPNVLNSRHVDRWRQTSTGKHIRDQFKEKAHENQPINHRIDSPFFSFLFLVFIKTDVENLYQYRDELFKPQSKPVDSSKNRYKLIRTRLEQILLNYNEVEGKNFFSFLSRLSTFHFFKSKFVILVNALCSVIGKVEPLICFLNTTNVQPIIWVKLRYFNRQMFLTLNELGESYAKNGEFEMAAELF